jgi:RNA polymerase sigma factor (sigma-70 family)
MEPVQQPVIDEEQAVVARMVAGDRQALAELYARHERSLRAYLHLLQPDPDLVEELLQDTLLAAWTGAQTYAGTASVQGWLFGIARRRARDALRRRSLRLVDAGVLEDVPSADLNPEEVLLAEAERNELTTAIAGLPLIHREVLMLTFVHELSYQDLAEVLAIPIGTVKSRLSHAKQAVRTQLRQRDVTR